MDARFHTVNIAHKTTCDWLFQKQEFQTWLNRDDLASNNGILWIKGKPGAGKSTLMKHAVLHCKAMFSKHLIAEHFFSARGTELEKTAEGLFRSLVCQLLERSQSIFASFLATYRTKRNRFGTQVKWSMEELQSFLISEMKRKQPQPLLLFVDALDECELLHVRRVVHFLEQLSDTAIEARNSLNICLSSRHYPNITIKSLSLIVEHQNEHDVDITIYVRDKLRIRNKEIEEELFRKASGVFMWVILVTEILNSMFDDGNESSQVLREKLHETPSDLDDLFHNILQDNNRYLPQTLLMLQWVLFSRRPLDPLELYFAVVAGTEPHSLGAWDPTKITLDSLRRFINSRSKGLIEIRVEFSDFCAQFIHETVKDFLIRKRRLQSLCPNLGPNFISESHNRLAKCCLFYMMMEELEVRRCPPRNKMPTTIHDRRRVIQKYRYPFLDYVSSYMLRHLDMALRGGVENTHILQLLLLENRVLDRFKHVSNLVQTYPRLEYQAHTSMLYIVSLCSHPGLVEKVLEAKVDINSHGGHYGNALRAALTIHPEGVPMDSIINVSEYINDRTAIIKMLLDAGADVDAGGGYLGNALQVAANSGIYEHVELLLEAGANVNLQGGFYGNALQAAASSYQQWFNSARDRKSIIKLLLAKGADVNAQGGYYGNTLQAAAMNGGFPNNTAVIKVLLEAGADANAQGGNLGNALRAAFTSDIVCDPERRLEIPMLLIDAGADINARGDYYNSALELLMEQGDRSDDIVRLMQKTGRRCND